MLGTVCPAVNKTGINLIIIKTKSRYYGNLMALPLSLSLLSTKLSLGGQMASQRKSILIWKKLPLNYAPAKKNSFKPNNHTIYYYNIYFICNYNIHSIYAIIYSMYT